MKRLLILVYLFACLLMASPVFAEMHGHVELGHAFDLELEYIDLNIEYDFPLLAFDVFVFGGVQTYFQVMTPTNMLLIHAIFPIGCKLQYEDFYIQIQRFCNHFISTPLYDLETWKKYAWSSWGTEISIGVEW